MYLCFDDNIIFVPLKNTCSGWKERCQVVSWLWLINKKLENDVEILALAVEVLDRFLGSVKVRKDFTDLDLKLKNGLSHLPMPTKITRSNGQIFSSQIQYEEG